MVDVLAFLQTVAVWEGYSQIDTLSYFFLACCASFCSISTLLFNWFDTETDDHLKYLDLYALEQAAFLLKAHHTLYSCVCPHKLQLIFNISVCFFHSTFLRFTRSYFVLLLNGEIMHLCFKSSLFWKVLQIFKSTKRLVIFLYVLEASFTSRS